MGSSRQLEGFLNWSHPAGAQTRQPNERQRTPAQRSNLFPLTAAGYMSWRAHSLSLLSGTAFDLTQEAALFRALCRPAAGQRWLDVGTSAGYYAALLAESGAHVLACDLSPAMLRVAQRRLRKLFPDLKGIDWALLNGEQTGLPRHSFDGVTIGATLNETSSPAAMLREAAALLKPGGQLWLMYLGRNGGLGQRALTRLGGLTFLDPAELGAHLPELERRDLRRVREVVFERWVKES
ncbi:class I SAM-dependent methyltransferase [Deinococcus sp. KNUC1210]|uniref:class I SAM-dependent methyltransferase n=1 Tax=Deinococcus sp. KNUC1210 TaxID=2917691 RepID=UPI001EF0DEE3|nr:class I SAM-dependent methyltransferase [Deinococcus sp. KNUC1210]ULH16444.1 class I SAM-dependent methyltransferase [Deinococcus sp. KNUC1210]